MVKEIETCVSRDGETGLSLGSEYAWLGCSPSTNIYCALGRKRASKSLAVLVDGPLFRILFRRFGGGVDKYNLLCWRECDGSDWLHLHSYQQFSIKLVFFSGGKQPWSILVSFLK
jgi:hypothetical protein